MVTFGERLHTAVRERGALCVGIDPHPYLLSEWGLPDNPEGVARFGTTVIAALGTTTALFKPQSAFYERHGSQGVAVLERLIGEIHDAGAQVVIDVKRGDIGTTMQAYADAYLDPASPLCADAITVSPYLGFGSLQPAVDTALEHANGLFVLGLTSNPEGPDVQLARTTGGRTVAGMILDHVRKINSGADPLGSVGCVVGVTHSAVDEDLSVNGPLLALGIGAQGATADDLPRVFGDALPQVIPSISREILQSGPDHDALRARAASFTTT